MCELLDQEDTDPARRDSLQRGGEALDDDRRETERELVDQDHLRARHERLGEDDHLLLASRQQPAFRLPAFLELGEELQSLRDALLGVGSGERVRRDFQVVLDRQPRQQPSALGDDGDPCAANVLGSLPVRS